MGENAGNQVTLLLRQVQESGREDDSRLAGELLPLLYDELKRIARSKMATQPAQTLQPTALVHEAYMRLVQGRVEGYESRRHFFFCAARAMQDILVEQARRRSALKRGGDRARLELETAEGAGGGVIFEEPVEDVAALGAALEELEKTQPRKAQLVRLRFFAGLSMDEIARVMELSEPTVRRELRFTRALLSAQLRGAAEEA